MASDNLSYGRWRGAQPARCWDDDTDNYSFLRHAVRSRRAKVVYIPAATVSKTASGRAAPSAARRTASKTASGRAAPSAARRTAWAQTSAASVAIASAGPAKARARKTTTCCASASCSWAMRAQKASAPSTSRGCHGRASGCGCAPFSRWVLPQAALAGLPMTLLAWTLSAAADHPCA